MESPKRIIAAEERRFLKLAAQRAGKGSSRIRQAVEAVMDRHPPCLQMSFETRGRHAAHFTSMLVLPRIRQILLGYATLGEDVASDLPEVVDIFLRGTGIAAGVSGVEGPVQIARQARLPPSSLSAS